MKIPHDLYAEGVTEEKAETLHATVLVVEIVPWGSCLTLYLLCSCGEQTVGLAKVSG